MSEDAQKQMILDAVMSHALNDLDRFLKDAEKGARNRERNRIKARKYRARKEAEEEAEYKESLKIPEIPEPPKPVEVSKPLAPTPVPAPAPAVEEEKPRRLSLLNLAEIQAQFQKGITNQEAPMKIPPLITSTKKK